MRRKFIHCSPFMMVPIDRFHIKRGNIIKLLLREKLTSVFSKNKRYILLRSRYSSIIIERSKRNRCTDKNSITYLKCKQPQKLLCSDLIFTGGFVCNQRSFHTGQFATDASKLAAAADVQRVWSWRQQNAADTECKQATHEKAATPLCTRVNVELRHHVIPARLNINISARNRYEPHCKQHNNNQS